MSTTARIGIFGCGFDSGDTLSFVTRITGSTLAEISVCDGVGDMEFAGSFLIYNALTNGDYTYFVTDAYVLVEGRLFSLIGANKDIFVFSSSSNLGTCSSVYDGFRFFAGFSEGSNIKNISNVKGNVHLKA